MVASPGPSGSTPAPITSSSPTSDPQFSPCWAKPLPNGFLYVNDSLSKLGRAPIEAIVVPAAQGARFYEPPQNRQVTYWTPTLEQVFKLNAALLLVAKQQPKISERVIEYRYQILGINEGTKLIFVNAFCRDHGRPAGKTPTCHSAFKQDMTSGEWVSWPAGTCPAQTWLHEPVAVDDGGACYFNFKYHPQTGAISDLQVNGEA